MYSTLLGDSVFDNKSYVKGGLSVLDHLKAHKATTDKVTLVAVDGNRINDVHKQLKRVPKTTTHLFISVGGNDALDEANIINEDAETVASVLYDLSDIAHRFEVRYKKMLKAVLKLKKPTTICTIYYPNFECPYTQKLTVAALTFFNDVIIRQAFLHKLPLIDLRLLCNNPADYANPIEPSEQGGLKIAKTILKIAAK